MTSGAKNQKIGKELGLPLGAEDRNGLLDEGEVIPNKKGVRFQGSRASGDIGLASQGLASRIAGTQLEFNKGWAQSAKSEYHDLVGHHEPNAAWATDEDQEDRSVSQSMAWSIIFNWKFEATAAAVIIMNAFVMGVQAEMNIEENGKNPANTKVVTNTFVDTMGYMFFVFYFIELVLRAWAWRWQFFTGRDKIWNSLDLLLVLTAVYDFIEKEIVGNNAGGNMSFFRTLRLLKMMKMLRVFRVMKFFRELRVMMYAIVGSLRLLFWAMLMLSLITYMFSLVFLQGVNQYLTSDNVDETARSDMILYWGSVGTSMVTLYEAISGGNDWSPLAAPLKPCGDFYYYLFLFYIAFLTFTVLNVLTGVVVDAAMNIAQIDGDNVTDEFMCNRLNDNNAVQELVDTIELNGDGYIQWDELLSGGQRSTVIRTFLENMDIDLEEVEGFYRLMQSAGREGKVKTADFIKGCGNLKLWGSSKSIESYLLMKDLASVKKQMNLNNQKILACFAKQGVELPEEDAADSGDEDGLFTLSTDFAVGGASSSPFRSDSWSTILDDCTDITLLNDINGRVAQRIEILKTTDVGKQTWSKNKKVKKIKTEGDPSSGGGPASVDDPSGASQESVTMLASLIVKEAMPLLVKEVERRIQTESAMAGFGSSDTLNTLPSIGEDDTKDAVDAMESSRSQTPAGASKKKFKGFNKGGGSRQSKALDVGQN